MKICQNICLDKISDKVENGSCQVKSSLNHNLEKPSVHSRGHIFSPILMKLGQNICFNEIRDEIENGSCWVKNKVTSSNLRKNMCTL